MTDRERLAYAAGLIDGEGCIFIARTFHRRDQRITHTLQIKVSMTSQENVEWIHRHFSKTPGSLNMENRASSGWHNVWTWRITGRAAEQLLRRLLPYLVGKKQQAIIALKFRKLFLRPCQKGLTAENFAERERFYREIRDAKQSFKVKAHRVVA